MKQLVFLIGLVTIVFIGCKREISISNEVFHLVDPSNHKEIKSEATCQFGDKKVEIFTFKDKSKGVADVQIGKYVINKGILSFPRGTFEMKKIGESYQLISEGKLRYLLLTEAEFSRLMKGSELGESYNSEALSEI